MENIISELKGRFRRGTIATQLIYINVGLFLIVSICHTINWLFQSKLGWLDDWVNYLILPSNPDQLLHQPWSIISYMFMHQGIWHLLFNMLCLYGFGQLFLLFFSARHLRGVYLFGGILGAITFLLAQFLPIFQAQGPSFLLGASASVLAIITAVAVKEPNYPVRLFLLGSIRMKYVALGLILISIISVPGGNAGGEMAHLGGALGGWFFTASLNKGRDLTKFINLCLDKLQSLFDWKLHTRKPKMKVYSAKEPKDWQFNARKKEEDKKIDQILDKLKRSGYESLTAEEKKSLFDASKR